MVRAMFGSRAATRVWPRVALFLLALALSLYGSSRALSAYPLTAAADGPYFHEMIEAVRASVVRYHELPLWNPYQCGGIPLWDNPQGLAASPVVWLLMPFFDTTRIGELWAVVHCTAGFLCMWVLARRELRMSVEAGLIASAAWAYAGAHMQDFNVGHLPSAPFLYFPLEIYLWRRAETNVRCAVGLGAMIALSVLEGALYPLTHLVVVLGAETLMRAWPPARWVSILRAAGVAAVAAFVFGASRILPLADQLLHHTRSGMAPDHDYLTWPTLKLMFLDRAHELATPGQQWEWHEYGAFLGPVILALAFVGIATMRLSHAWLLALLAWCFVLMLGPNGDLAPASILKAHVYPFTQMRVFVRFSRPLTLFLAAFAGLAVDRLSQLARRHLPWKRFASGVHWGLVALAACGVWDIMHTGFFWEQHNGFYLASAAAVPSSPNLYLERRESPQLASFIDQPRQNLGTVYCWEEWAFERGAPFWLGDKPQATARDNRATVKAVVRTQNSFAVDLDATESARVLLNTAYDRGWRANVGTVVRDGGLLAVDVPAGHYHLVVRYWPSGLTLGFALSAGGFLGVLVYGIRDVRRRRASGK
jgi:hypothetical protein